MLCHCTKIVANKIITLSETGITSSSAANFPTFMWGRCFLWGASCASPLDNSLSDKSFLMLSNHLRIGLLLLLFPGMHLHHHHALFCPHILLLLFIYLFIYLFILLNYTCPYHFNLTLLYFLVYFSHLRWPSILSFPILTSLLISLINLNILVSAKCE